MIADLNRQVDNSIAANKTLIDEHQALQTLYNSHERKLNESQIEKEQLVSSLKMALEYCNDNNYTPNQRELCAIIV